MLIDLDLFGHFLASLTISSLRMCFVKETEVSLNGLDIRILVTLTNISIPLSQKHPFQWLKKKKVDP